MTIGHTLYMDSNRVEAQPSIPTLEPVRELEISHPQFTLPESEFTLTAPAETDATQTLLF